MIVHDRLFKELLQTFFFEFLELFVPAMAAAIDRDHMKLLDKEVFTDVTAGDKHIVDLVVEARFKDKGALLLFHVETQGLPEAEFNRRMFKYFSRFHEKTGLPVYPIVIFAHNSPKRQETDSYPVAFPDLTVLQFRYKVIKLNRLRWRDYLDARNPVAAALMSKMDIEPADRPRVKAECLRLLVTLRLDPARTRLISGFVDTYLKLSAEEDRVFRREVASFAPVEQEEMMEIVTSWMEEGLQKGLAQGIEKGLQQGIERGLQQGIEKGIEKGVHDARLSLALRLLTRRLGPLPEEVEINVRALSSAALAELAEAAIDLHGPDDLDRWFAEVRGTMPSPRPTGL